MSISRDDQEQLAVLAVLAAAAREAEELRAADAELSTEAAQEVDRRLKLFMRTARQIRLQGGESVSFILWIIAVVLVVWGIAMLLRGAVLAGIALIVLGLLVGPGGVSIFT